MSTELTVAEKPAFLNLVVSPGQFLEAHGQLTQFIQSALKEGSDYGVIPGTQSKEPTLLKPGAERIAKAFGASMTFKIIESEKDHDREVYYEKKKWNNYKKCYEMEKGKSFGFYRFVVACILTGRDGIEHGQGMGSCSTMESKYVDRPRDLENTVLKMAQKRAMVAAVLNAYGLSGMFTQDEDEREPNTEATIETKTGFDLGNPEHGAWLSKFLANYDVTADQTDKIRSRMAGKPNTELSLILADMDIKKKK